MALQHLYTKFRRSNVLWYHGTIVLQYHVISVPWYKVPWYCNTVVLWYHGTDSTMVL